MNMNMKETAQSMLQVFEQAEGNQDVSVFLTLTRGQHVVGNSETATISGFGSAWHIMLTIVMAIREGKQVMFANGDFEAGEEIEKLERAAMELFEMEGDLIKQRGKRESRPG